jgi:hypothetical protein
MKKIIAGIDFDGTITTHEFPEIGEDIGAIPYLKKLTDAGHLLILWTMRSNRKGEIDRKNRLETRNTLQEAVDYLTEKGIPLFGVNENPDQKSWTDSPKIYANIYVDDAAAFVPLTNRYLDKYGNIQIFDRPFVDWTKMGPYLLKLVGIE